MTPDIWRTPAGEDRHVLRLAPGEAPPVGWRGIRTVKCWSLMCQREPGHEHRMVVRWDGQPESNP